MKSNLFLSLLYRQIALFMPSSLSPAPSQKKGIEFFLIFYLLSIGKLYSSIVCLTVLFCPASLRQYMLFQHFQIAPIYHSTKHSEQQGLIIS